LNNEVKIKTVGCLSPRLGKLPSWAHAHKRDARADNAAAGWQRETEAVDGAGRREEGIAAPFFELVFRAGIVFLAAGGDFECLLQAGSMGLPVECLRLMVRLALWPDSSAISASNGSR
jgi:hypothetical protein